MFEIRKITGIKKNSEAKIYNLSELPNEILLIPDCLEDTTAKINNYVYQGIHLDPFVNGYARIAEDKLAYFRKDGEIIHLDPEHIASFYSFFSGDRAIVKTTIKHGVVYGHINGQTGELIYASNPQLDQTKPTVGHYNCGFAPAEYYYQKLHLKCWRYNDLDGKPVSDCYKQASCFYKGEAVVETLDGSWQIINTKFKVLKKSRDETYDQIMAYMLDRFNHADVYKNDNITVKETETGSIVTDLSIGFSPRIYDIIRALSNKLQINIEGLTVNEQLYEIIGEACKKGCYLFNIDTLSIISVSVLNGVQVLDENGNVAISYDEQDKELLRFRNKK